VSKIIIILFLIISMISFTACNGSGSETLNTDKAVSEETAIADTRTEETTAAVEKITTKAQNGMETYHYAQVLIDGVWHFFTREEWEAYNATRETVEDSPVDFIIY